ncbi:restriction endonuclease subunit S [Clostridium swellfunianum]|uniref:restriction endonuclease subunit S n=1 Tax=Clostridium swellfunianum TaxID=1367462 RepID=UPI002030A5C6|nr:restriction endonuclease subunit S [Clostridium swellfunianum]MCM0648415.1 restriction endonuclease subunit S [Clostridium swellfunianum]
MGSSAWEEVKLGDIVESVSIKHKFNKDKIVLINTSDVLEGKVLNHTYVDNKDLKGQFKKSFQKGDILYSEIRPQNKRFAYINFDAEDYVASTKLMVLRKSSKNVNTEFLFQLLKGEDTINRLQILAETRSGTFPQITYTELASLKIMLPPIEEQESIAKILSDLDAKIEVNNKINDNLVELATTLYTSWFVKFEPFFESEFIDTEYGLIPRELKIKKVEELQPKLETGKRPKGGVSGFDTGMPSVGAESIKGIGYFDYSKTKYVPVDYAVNMTRGIVSGYELLIYKDGGKPGYFMPNFSMFGEGFPYDSFVLNEHVFLLDFGDKAFNMFSYFHFQSEYIRHLLHTAGCKAAIPGINQKDILSLYIFSKDNPKVKEFCAIASPMITTILKNSKQNRTLSQLRDTLLLKLMSGEIDLSNLEINL